ncbi:hypothetical protein [Aureispira anguillae]|uniref:Uncharacterized protein n=1 Tax=Aureispira anguillae TaxID=2864201 RepID=A0A916DQX3_9BACT|nr:hypothetical protein [Aureispira anguillae]BDS10956.1 hypothetical protein AsAng_0016660 [Aureispira anguillae]
MEILEEIKDKPKFFSKRGVILISTLYSPLFGGLVYVSNLQEIEKRNLIFPTIISMLILNGLIYTKFHPALSFIPSLLRYFLLNAIGGLILTGPFWDYHLKEENTYEERKIWSPLLAGFILYGGFIAFGYYLKYQNQ